MLEKLRVKILWHYSGPFGLLSDHSFYFFKGLGLPSVVRHATPTILGCWALIAPALVFHFEQDDHLILLNVVAHVKIDIYPF
jgi:hypothetical protein